MFNLSIVNISKDQYVQSVNEFASLCGCGENSLSVKLVDSKGSVYWGCHSWWKPEDYTSYKALDIPIVYQESMTALYERKVLDGDAQQNWNAALNELGLSMVE